MTATPIARRTRATTIQVPGEAPKQPDHEAQGTSQAAALSTDQVAALSVGDDFPAFAATQFPEAIQPVIDMEVLRAQIRAEERDQARHEISMQIQAAASVVNQPASASTIAGNRSNYRTMRAADIDHTRLTAPVLSLDGWVCPPAPEAKK